MPQARVQHPDPSAEYYFEEGCHITEWWNLEDDPALSVARARVPPGVTTRWHRLIDTVERYLILSGEGRVEVEGLEPQRVAPHSLVFIPAGARQRIANTGPGDLVFLALCTPRFTPAAYQETGPP